MILKGSQHLTAKCPSIQIGCVIGDARFSKDINQFLPERTFAMMI